MKKLMVILLVFMFVFSGFAQSKSDLKSDENSKAVKFLTYEATKSGAVIPFLLNLFLGFGIGSFVQGDIAGGFSILGSGAAGVALLATGGFLIFKGEKELKSTKRTIGITLASLGGAVLVITRITELIIPFTYAASYNAKLREKLVITIASESDNYKGFVPNFNINMNEATVIGFDLSFKKAY